MNPEIGQLRYPVIGWREGNPIPFIFSEYKFRELMVKELGGHWKFKSLSTFSKEEKLAMDIEM